MTTTREPVGVVASGGHRVPRVLFRLPGVYRPQEDTRLLASVAADYPAPFGTRVLDLCTGTGALALAAATVGAGAVTAVDISRSAVWSAKANAWWHRLPVQVHRMSFLDMANRRFDLVLANPPYVPARVDRDPRWDAGFDGRSLLDPLCDAAPGLLTETGTMLLVHSAVSGVDATLDRLRSGGLRGDVVARQRVPFGPVMRARARSLEHAGLIEPGTRHEDLVVVRASRA
ncbi:methyltransferase [Actinokineospora auranticolor]|uniref:Release factor glutamine methyltransferase n=1 Tax=Actinokineospora auranticolor TaxID=155976 RepID=A0A2S6H1A0_9PSEU|nr:HemK2/MTQ2 family protein methyltransferase [Actinokineospora auranticolor]PPK71234.1 release factor glutamine methyltransferase [Actinokineospora auranticolor]